MKRKVICCQLELGNLVCEFFYFLLVIVMMHSGLQSNKSSLHDHPVDIFSIQYCLGSKLLRIVAVVQTAQWGSVHG